MKSENFSSDITIEFERAVSKQKNGEPEESLKIYHKIESIMPNNFQVANNMRIAVLESINKGILLHNNGYFSEAEGVFEKILEVDGHNHNATMILGIIKRYKGEFKESLNLIAKSVALDPGSEASRINLQESIIIISNAAAELYRKDDFVNAASLLEAILSIRPKRYISADDAARLFKQCQATAAQLYNRKFHNESARLIRSILSNYQSAESLHIAGLIAADQNKHVIAVKIFESAIDQSQNNSNYYISMAKSLYALKQYEAAENAFSMSLERDSSYIIQKKTVINQINHYVHNGKYNRNKSLLFCTSYVDSDDSWNKRYKLWMEYYKNSVLARHNICMIDDGGGHRPDCGDIIFHRFDNRLGRKSETNFPGWWRSFLFSVEIARREGCNKIIHIESDAFLISNRIMLYIDSIQNGWVSFWCRRWQMPESAIQVICEDNFDKISEISEKDLRSDFFLKSAESLLPFTETIKFFKGDRYGEYIDHIPDDADYVCQLSGNMRHAINMMVRLIPPTRVKA
ncbi:hypothetical protein AZL_f00980 (plasmid) [Azospirillum sp. B510]|uniref:tetratricopeptide repeat protein n=1 Tax=Azospirillum sp. (strain B510) TaxID=137722 RepID=UPI0001C4CF8D|nr:hypothetical protein [Azospirillum sp. B510]BAI76858.1 hypothetical protein AZL_f00980 [Azospirillum sp. B510]